MSVTRTVRIISPVMAVVAAWLIATVSRAQEPQRPPSTGDVPGQAEKKPIDDRPFLERTVHQIEEQTRRQIEALHREKEKIQAQTQKRLEELDAQAEEAALKAKMRIQLLPANLKQRVNAPAISRSMEEKLDGMMERLDRLEGRLNRLERELARRSPEAFSKSR